MGHREDPLEHEIFYVGCIDLVQAAVPIPVKLAIVGGPITRPWIQNSGKSDVLNLGSGLRIGRFQGSWLYPCELAQIGAEILDLIRGRVQWLHRRMLVFYEPCYV